MGYFYVKFHPFLSQLYYTQHSSVLQERDAFLLELSQCELVNRMQGDSLSDVLEMWREGTISNWEYLTQLNKMAGRSYNDLMQYPVFPFVLADYTSAKLDLTDPKSFRNFKKPMAIQNKCNEQHYIDTYNVRTMNLICKLLFVIPEFDGCLLKSSLPF